MTAPTVAVTVKIFDSAGQPSVGTVVSARLDKVEVYQGFIVGGEFTATTDAAGTAVLHLFPNHPTTGLGTTGSVYTFRATPVNGRPLRVTAQVPNVDCPLDTIADLDPEPALSTAQMAQAAAAASAAASATSAAASATSAQLAADKAQVATDQAAVATTKAGVATDQATLATTQVGLATNQVTLAAAQATAANASAQQALAIYGSTANLNAAQAIMQGLLTQTQAQASLAAAQAVSASSVAQQDLSGVLAAALYRGPNAVVATCFMDLSKDSDGGAWGDKCQSLSWYNEPLNGTWLGSFASEMDARDYFGSLGASSVVTGDSSTFTGGLGAWGAPSNPAGGKVENIAGRMRLTCLSAGVSVAVELAATTVVGQRYQIIYTKNTVGAASRNQFIEARTAASGGGSALAAQVIVSGLGAGTVTYSFVATGTTTYLRWSYSSALLVGEYVEMDDFTVKPVDLSKNPSGAYYNDSTDGKHKRLWSNLLRNSADPTGAGWAILNNSGAVTRASTGAVSFGASATDQLYQSGIAVTIPAGVAMTGAVKLSGAGTVRFNVFDGNGSVIAGTVVTVNLTATPTWYAINYTTAIAGLNGGLLVQNNVAGTATNFTFHGAMTMLGTVAAGNIVEEVKGADQSQSETFRGNKAKPPRLGLAVAEATRVVIYDLLEPGRPMWAVIRPVSNTTGTPSGITGVAYKEACLTFVGNGNVIASQVWEFAAGRIRHRDSAGSRTLALSIATQQLSTTALSDGGGTIVHTAVNAVAMTAMPDAPVDPVTGLQVPTIAVATAGGVSVIHNNGTVVNSANTSPASRIRFDARRNLWWDNQNTTSQFAASYAAAGFASSGMNHIATGAIPLAVPLGNSNVTAQSTAGLTSVWANANGLAWVRHNQASPANSLYGYVAAAYNTGPMLNPIRAWGCDVSAGVLSAVERLVNGTFDTDLTGWTNASTGTGSASVSGGTVSITGAGAGNSGLIYQAFATTPGETFTLSWVSNSGGTFVTARAGTTPQGFELGFAAGAATGPSSFQFTATSATTYVTLAAAGTTGTAVIDSVSVKGAILDRSYKNKPLTLFGTLSKTAVAAAAQVVFYGGFSAANYGQEAYSADWDVGTGAWSWRVPMVVPAALTPAMFPEVTGAELVVNGGFDADANWTKGNGWAISGGVAVHTPGAAGSMLQGAAVAGKFYRVTWTAAGSTTSSTSAYAGGAVGAAVVGNGTFTQIVKATGTQAIGVSCGTAFDGSIDNVSIKEVGPAIAMGRSSVGGSAMQQFGLSPDGTLVGIVTDSVGTTRTVATTQAYNTGLPIVPELVYNTDGTLCICVNGKQVAMTTGAPLASINNATAVVTWGNSRTLDAAFPGQLAMTIAQAAAPFAEQSQFAYEQQKQMFQPGAQVTLADSASVVDMSYDEQENSLTVASATAKGKFVGLVRVNSETPSAGSFSKVAHYNGVKVLARSGTNPGVDIVMPAQNLKEELQRKAEDAARVARQTRQVRTYRATSGQTSFPLGVDDDLVNFYVGGSLKTEGAADDYTVGWDGFKPTVTTLTGVSLNTVVKAEVRRTT